MIDLRTLISNTRALFTTAREPETPKLKKPPDLYAVWRYDQFPYYLCAEVERIDEDGYVRAKGYQGYRFKPVTLLYGESGERTKRYLIQARSAHRDILQSGENAIQDAHREKMLKLGVQCGQVGFKAGMRYPIIGKIFEDAIAKMEKGDAPTFAWHPDPDLIKSERRDDPEAT